VPASLDNWNQLRKGIKQESGSVFWVAVPFSLVEFIDVSEVLAVSNIRKTSTRLHGATSQNTAIFMLAAVRI
jgi:hypothetical protein